MMRVRRRIWAGAVFGLAYLSAYYLLADSMDIDLGLAASIGVGVTFGFMTGWWGAGTVVVVTAVVAACLEALAAPDALHNHLDLGPLFFGSTAALVAGVSTLCGAAIRAAVDWIARHKDLPAEPPRRY
jgi:hypothetical protein